MADTKASALTELTAFDGDEEFYVVDDDDGTPVSKRVTIENLTTEVTDGIAEAIADGDASTLTSAQTYADGKVSNTAYGSGWDTDTTHAPSKNATYDEIELRAPKASPTFTGTPAAPTAAQGTNTTQVATTAYVQTEVGLLVPKSVLTTDGDLLTRASGAVARITRASLAADSAFTAAFAPITIGSGCSLTKSAGQSVTTGTDTPITFDGEEYDDAAFHDNATNNSRITIPANYGGRFLFGGSVDLDSLGDGKEMSVWFKVNGTTDYKRTVTVSGGVGKDIGPFFSKPLVLSAGDYVELYCRHDHGSSLTTRTTANGLTFWCMKIK